MSEREIERDRERQRERGGKNENSEYSNFILFILILFYIIQFRFVTFSLLIACVLPGLPSAPQTGKPEGYPVWGPLVGVLT